MANQRLAIQDRQDHVDSVKRVFVSAVVGGAALLAALGAASAQVPGSVVVDVEAAEGSSVGGSVIVAPLGEGTAVDLGLRGLEAGVEYTATLHGGSCAAPGASLAPIVTFTAGAAGTVTASGEVLFRGTEPTAFDAAADGEHVILVNSPSGVVACAVIVPPAQPASPIPAASGSAGLVDEDASRGGVRPFALVAVGILVLGAAVAGVRQVSALRD